MVRDCRDNCLTVCNMEVSERSERALMKTRIRATTKLTLLSINLLARLPPAPLNAHNLASPRFARCRTLTPSVSTLATPLSLLLPRPCRTASTSCSEKLQSRSFATLALLGSATFSMLSTQVSKRSNPQNGYRQNHIWLHPLLNFNPLNSFDSLHSFCSWLH